MRRCEGAASGPFKFCSSRRASRRRPTPPREAGVEMAILAVLDLLASTSGTMTPTRANMRSAFEGRGKCMVFSPGQLAGRFSCGHSCLFFRASYWSCGCARGPRAFRLKRCSDATSQRALLFGQVGVVGEVLERRVLESLARGGPCCCWSRIFGGWVFRVCLETDCTWGCSLVFWYADAVDVHTRSAAHALHYRHCFCSNATIRLMRS